MVASRYRKFRPEFLKLPREEFIVLRVLTLGMYSLRAKSHISYVNESGFLQSFRLIRCFT